MIHSIDLTVANRIHIVEPNWNPMVEAQAIDRVHRMGQTRDVFVTKYIVKNSIETVNTTCLACKKALKLNYLAVHSMGSGRQTEPDQAVN